MAPDLNDGINPERSEARAPPTKRKRRPRTTVACDSCRTRKVKLTSVMASFRVQAASVNHKFQCSYKEMQPHTILSGVDRGRAENSSREPYPALRPQPRATPNIQSTLPISLDDDLASAGEESVSEHIGTLNPEPATDSADNSTGLGHVNQHTGGSEFYGSSGTFYFLSRLRSHAKSGIQSANNHSASSRGTPERSVIDLLHSSDYPVSSTHTTGIRQSLTPRTTAAEDGESSAMTGPPDESFSQYFTTSPVQFEVEIQRECVRLYFENLHCVHPILDHPSFLRRCENDVWKLRAARDTPRSQNQTKRLFPALFNIVLALGAITAGGTSMLTSHLTVDFLERVKSQVTASSPSYVPIRVAQFYFDRAKLLLGDVFESTSIESAQTLFLMNALKPHSCYMYSGMALRTALAIGLPTTNHVNTIEERLLWWAMYSSEIEMCSSSGRRSFLQTPNHYTIPLPPTTGSKDSLLPFVNYMVDLARILAEVAANANILQDEVSKATQSNRCMELEARLLDWKSCLPQTLNFEEVSLSDNELVTKQKVVLKLRFLNTKLLIHRPFLLSSTTEKGRVSPRHVSSCVEAARETIRFLHHTYTYRPYFRTWWYNCTYVLDASMVLLYVVLVDICSCPVEEVLADIQKSLDIFSAMDVVSVARMCTKITNEVLQAAKKSHLNSHQERQAPVGLVTVPASEEHDQRDVYSGPEATLTHDQGAGHAEGVGLNYEELYATLADPNLVYNFLSFEDWSALSRPEDDLYEGLGL
ncbi:hypothetical protein NM208_g7941 [Fusarium decemcellulare]|uniref:Uncharacterized protein n=1 Tax=Fusarium decemcellulare TaxID=57161 RepID=A0ACC1S7A8_9HYPO|nr:hypothetical protein NM208_g7941 [Fusarium decemcellulare]